MLLKILKINFKNSKLSEKRAFFHEGISTTIMVSMLELSSKTRWLLRYWEYSTTKNILFQNINKILQFLPEKWEFKKTDLKMKTFCYGKLHSDFSC